MASNKLTDALCKGYKPTGKGYKKSDGQGMYLFISPAGSKVWRMGYRDGNGREQTLVIGAYPLLSLKDARIARDEFKRRLLKGEDVKAKAKRSISFSEAVALYWAGRKDVSEGYKANATRGLAMHIEHFVGLDPISSITRERLLELLLKLDAAGKHVYAKRLRVWAGQVFDWAVELGHCQTNPAALIKPEKAFGSKPVEHHASLALKEIPDFFDRLALEASLQSVLACHMLALTWVRTGELRMMKWEQIEGDIWRVPGPVMKMKREHLVPLSKQALGLLNHLRLQHGGYSKPPLRNDDLLHRHQDARLHDPWRNTGSKDSGQKATASHSLGSHLLHPKSSSASMFVLPSLKRTRTLMLVQLCGASVLSW